MKSESAKPLIGIVVCGLSDNRQFVSNPYIQSVRYSGGIPILLPLIRSDSMLQQYLRLCDGFLFCGGNDITPLLFGQEPREGIGNTNITLDLFQIRLMKLILSSTKPVFSICRGMQIFNTACQGTMFQDIRYQPGESLDHMQRSDSRSDVSHPVRIERSSRLFSCLGRSVYVNSFHHQAIDRPGVNLKVSALAPDQTIEAIEHSSHPLPLEFSGIRNVCFEAAKRCGDFSIALLQPQKSGSLTICFRFLHVIFFTELCFPMSHQLSVPDILHHLREPEASVLPFRLSYSTGAAPAMTPYCQL